MNARTKPVWWWLGATLPLVVYLAHYVALNVLDPSLYVALWTGEQGLTERATLLALVLALLLGLTTTVRMYRYDARRLMLWWFALFSLGCLYFGGEEASWGQHLFGWNTPAGWQALNNQNETNLHNANGIVGSLLDQLARNLITLAILIGGGILPLVHKVRGTVHRSDTRKYWLLPGTVCVPAGLIAPLSTVPQKLTDNVPHPLSIQFGEVKELMIALFLLIYIAAVWSALRTHRPPAAKTGVREESPDREGIRSGP